jgi:hypothetical protein
MNNDEALLRAHQNATDAVTRAQQQRDQEEAAHIATTAEIFREARATAEFLASRGYPDIQVVTHREKRRGFLGGSSVIEVGGWMVYELADGGDGGGENSKYYVLSDGRLQWCGGEPFTSVAKLRTPDGAVELLRRIRQFRAHYGG